MIYSDELTEPVSVRAKRIWKTEESRNFLDLEKLVGELSLRIRRDDADYIAQSRKISECAAFVEQLIDRMRKRADFEAARDSTKLSAVEREIHDLEAVLLRLRAPVEPS